MKELHDFLEFHRSILAKIFGGTIGIAHGVEHYWESLQEDDFIKFAMGSLGTIWYTFLGVAVAWVLNKYVFKMSKK